MSRNPYEPPVAEDDPLAASTAGKTATDRAPDPIGKMMVGFGLVPILAVLVAPTNHAVDVTYKICSAMLGLAAAIDANRWRLSRVWWGLVLLVFWPLGLPAYMFDRGNAGARTKWYWGLLPTAGMASLLVYQMR
jgi:hypothetical protein